MMISWRLCLTIAVIFYSKSATSTSCYYDYECYGSETCCSDNFCRSSCSGGSGDDGVIIVVVVCVCVGIGKLVALVWYCCWRKRRRIVTRQGNPAIQTVIVRTTLMTPTGSQGYTTLTEDNNTVQHGFINLGHDSPPETTLNQGDVIANPTNDPPPPYSKEIQS